MYESLSANAGARISIIPYKIGWTRSRWELTPGVKTPFPKGCCVAGDESPAYRPVSRPLIERIEG